MSEEEKKKHSKIINTPDEAGSALAEIQSRAAGGKVAVIERGAKEARVIEMGDKKAKSEKQTSGPAIPLSEAAIENINDLKSDITDIDLEIGRNTKMYTRSIQKLTEQAVKSEESLNSSIRRILKKHEAPEGWVVDLDKMVIIPNPNQQPPQMMMTPSN